MECGGFSRVVHRQELPFPVRMRLISQAGEEAQTVLGPQKFADRSFIWNLVNRHAVCVKNSEVGGPIE